MPTVTGDFGVTLSVTAVIGGAKMKVVLLLAVPPGVVTVIGPLAPLPTVAVMVVALTTVKDAAGGAAEGTAVAPVKLAAGDGDHRAGVPADRGEGGDGRRRDGVDDVVPSVV